MIGFSLKEILSSVLFAIAFGSGYSVLYLLLLSLRILPLEIGRVFLKIRGSDSILPPPKVIIKIKEEFTGRIFLFASVILFSVCFLLLSYVSLDGQIRLYMLIFYSASFFLSKFAFCSILEKVASLILLPIIAVISCLFRAFFIAVKKFRPLLGFKKM